MNHRSLDSSENGEAPGDREERSLQHDTKSLSAASPHKLGRQATPRPRQLLLRQIGAILAALVLLGTIIVWASYGLPLLVRAWKRSAVPALLVSEGDLGSRLYAICAARTYSRQAGIHLKILWKSDKWLPATRFRELFKNPELDVVDDLYGQISLSSGWSTWQSVADRATFSAEALCVEGTAGDGNQTAQKLDFYRPYLASPRGLYVTAPTRPCQLWGSKRPLDDCQVAQEMRECYQQFNPLPEVEHFLIGLDWTATRKRIGVLLQVGKLYESPPIELSTCPMPAPAKGASSAASVQESSQSSRRRLLHTGNVLHGAQDQGPAHTAHTVPSGGLLDDLFRILESNVKDGRGPKRRLREVQAGLPGSGSGLLKGNSYLLTKQQLERNGSQHGSWSSHWSARANLSARAMLMKLLREPSSRFFVGGTPPQGVRAIIDQFHKDATPQRLGFATGELQDLCRGSFPDGDGAPLFAAKHVLAMGRDREPLIACARRELADLLVLSYTLGLIHTVPSGAVDFVTARAAVNTDVHFVRQVPIKYMDTLVPLRKQRWSELTYVDEKHGLLYCSIPKVACTTLRLWMRRLNGLPELDRWSVDDIHDPAKNGLKTIARNFNDLEAMHIVTNPRAFKFVFVRNPWTRALSAFLDKAKSGGAQHDPWGWAHVFFGELKVPIPGIEWNNTEKHIPFKDFVRLVKEMVNYNRLRMEAHIALQTDLCWLHAVQYNFVGHMESLNTDFEKVVSAMQLHTEQQLPDMGRAAHPTNSDAKLVANYNKQLVEDVERAYFLDMRIPLNNISFQPPENIRNLQA